MIDLDILALAAILSVAYTAQTISGFGVVVIALTFSAHFMPIPVVLSLIIPLSIGQCTYLAVRYRGAIEWPLLLRRVLPLMGIGVVAGVLLAPHIAGYWLRKLFAAMVLALSSWELARLVVRPKATTRPLGPLPLVVTLLSAGVIHGIYASGGPMLVYAFNRVGLSKSAFRTTLVTVWLTFNIFLAASFANAGAYDWDTLTTLLLLAPAVPIGLIVGEHLHHRVDEHRFKIVTFALLAAAALPLLLR